MVQAVRDLVDWLLAESPKMKNSLHGMQPLALASPLLMHLPSSHPPARPPARQARNPDSVVGRASCGCADPLIGLHAFPGLSNGQGTCAACRSPVLRRRWC